MRLLKTHFFTPILDGEKSTEYISDQTCYSSDASWASLGLTRPASGEDFVLPSENGEGDAKHFVFMVMDVPEVTFGQVTINPGAVMFFPDDDGIDQHTIRSVHQHKS